MIPMEDHPASGGWTKDYSEASLATGESFCVDMEII